MKLMRFKDDTYTWIEGDTRSGVLNKTEAIAYGVWQLKVLRDEVMMGIESLVAHGTNMDKDNVAIFGNINKIFLYVSKMDNTDHTEYEQQGDDLIVQ